MDQDNSPGPVMRGPDNLENLDEFHCRGSPAHVRWASGACGAWEAARTPGPGDSPSNREGTPGSARREGRPETEGHDGDTVPARADRGLGGAVGPSQEREVPAMTRTRGAQGVRGLASVAFTS